MFGVPKISVSNPLRMTFSLVTIPLTITFIFRVPNLWYGEVMTLGRELTCTIFKNFVWITFRRSYLQILNLKSERRLHNKTTNCQNFQIAPTNFILFEPCGGTPSPTKATNDLRFFVSGRSLSILSSSVLQIDPDNLEEAFKLRGWYDMHLVIKHCNFYFNQCRHC